MGVEIERKFLVAGEEWRDQANRSVAYRQAYLARDGGVSVRVRIAGKHANLNLKSATLDITRVEFEYEIPLSDAETLVRLATGNVVEKTRYFVEYSGHTWEIDVFEGANAGLVLAEIELGSVDEPFAHPPWLGMEVSDDERYYNVYLAEHPYRSWPARA